MSDSAGDQKNLQQADEDVPEPGGINLTLVYSLLGIALLAAIFFAIFVVKPFYLRR